MDGKNLNSESAEQPGRWLVDCPDCGEKKAIAYQPDILDYECPHCHHTFSAHELVQYQRQLKRQFKLNRLRLLAIGALVALLLLLIPILTVRVNYDEARNAINFTAPGVQLILSSSLSGGPELQFYLIGNYLGRWKLSPRPVIEPETEPTTTPAPEERQTPTPPLIPKPATLDSA
ncbi:MAG TPA: hypothetical protein PKE64_06720 [Anaerolineae bacterium]|nr:hypothetical protein [Anaerolineae bacterium]